WAALGHIVALIANIHRFHDWVTSVLAAAGHNFEFRGRLTGVRYFGTCDPSNVRHIFTSNFANYPKGDHLAEIFHDAGGGGIINVDGDSWRLQRTRLQTLLTGALFRAFAARRVRDKAADLPEVPVARAMDDVSETCFLRHVVPCWKLMRRLGDGRERKMAAARKTIDGFVAEVISRVTTSPR
ncbi:hypothetical protein EJB05_14639, partial [Eragrostis curvula]